MNSVIAESDRFYARLLYPEDLDEIIILEADEEVKRYSGGVRSAIEAEDYLNTYLDYNKKHKTLGLWAVIDKENSSFLGFVCLKNMDNTNHIEIGYRLHKHAWGRGVATEISKAVMEYGWTKLNLESIVGVVEPGNTASQRVLEKLGLKYIRDDFFYRSEVKFYEMKNPYHKERE